MNPDLHVAARIATLVGGMQPESILQVGLSSGILGAMCREVLEFQKGRFPRKTWTVQVDGLTWPPDERTPLFNSVYDRVSHWAPERLDTLKDYDVTICIDPRKYLAPDLSLTLVRELLAHTNRVLLLVTPVQGETGTAPEWVAPLLTGLRYDVEHMGTAEAPFSLYVIQPRSQALAEAAAIQVGPALAEVDAVWDKPSPPRNRPLRVGYLIPHHNLTGGMKMLMEQIRHLRRRGHKVHAVAHGLSGSTVLPPWTDVTVDSEQRLAREEPLAAAMGDVDVVMAGYFHQLGAAARLKSPALYLEQGHEHLFQDANAHRAPELSQLFEEGMRLPIALAGVSPMVEAILKSRFNRHAGLILNGIDTGCFRPGSRPRRNRVLLVGNPSLTFKGFPEALQVLDHVHDALGSLEVTWISQIPVKIQSDRYQVNLIVNPSQEEIPEIYRTADVFLFTSHYEAFGMPPLEAMASGLPVVATDNGGIRTYGRPGENCLLADPGDIESLAWGVLQVLQNPELADHLSVQGRKTAEQFTWEAAVDQLEDALYRTAVYFPGAKPLT